MFTGNQHILINRFCALDVKQNGPRPTLFLTKYQAEWNNQKLMKNTHLFYILFQVSKVVLKKILLYSCHFIYFVLFYINF